MSKIISTQKMQEIAANMDDQGDHRYSHKEMRALLKAQRDSSDRESLQDLKAILNDAGSLKELETQLVDYIATLDNR